LYRVQISESKIDNRPGMWVQFTKLQRGRQGGGFGGGGQYGGGQRGL